MKQARLLGFFTKTKHEDANSYNEHASGFVKHYVVVDLGGAKKTFTVEDSYGSCYSGYCGANWGRLDLELKDYSGKAELYKFNEKDLFINVVNGTVVSSILEPEEQFHFDAIVTTVHLTDGRRLAVSTGDGGCSYYPSGSAYLDKELIERNFKPQIP